jgi:hypothetical protein
MKHYKTFGQSFGDQPKPPPITPIENLQFEDFTPEPHMRAIRQNQIRQSHRPINENFEETYHSQHYPQPQPQHPQPQPQHYPQPQPHRVQQQEQAINPNDISCKLIVAHINSCQLCKKLYQRNNDIYITIIAVLLIFCLFLLSKLLDRK